MNPLIQNYIQQLKDVQNGRNWIGTSFERMLKEITEEIAFIRPLPDVHSIAEILSHLTLWREEAILKINSGKGSKTDDCEENWLNNETLKKKGWLQIQLDYQKSLSELIGLLEGKEDSFLSEIYYDTDFKGEFNYQFLLDGMLHHDLYHLGQLGVIRKYLHAS